MGKLFGLAILAFVAAVGWKIGGSLSSDSLGMAVGMLFGIMASIPTALILLESQNRERRVREREERVRHKEVKGWYKEIENKPAAPPAAPQVVNNHYHYHAAPEKPQAAPEGKIARYRVVE